MRTMSIDRGTIFDGTYNRNPFDIYEQPDEWVEYAFIQGTACEGRDTLRDDLSNLHDYAKRCKMLRDAEQDLNNSATIITAVKYLLKLED